jgi:hypothetical protein
MSRPFRCGAADAIRSAWLPELARESTLGVVCAQHLFIR